MIKGTIQAATEQAIHEAIDQGDERTLDAYGEHAGTWLDGELSTSICVGLLHAQYATRRGDWPGLLAIIMDRSPELALALVKLDQHISKHRAEFMEDHSQRCMAEEDRMKEDAA